VEDIIGEVELELVKDAGFVADVETTDAGVDYEAVKVEFAVFVRVGGGFGHVSCC